MANYSISGQSSFPLFVFQEPVAPPEPEPDPLADVTGATFHYLGGRAGVWRAPILHGEVSGSTIESLGLEAPSLDLTGAGPVISLGASAFAPPMVFSYPVGETTYGSPFNLGSYNIGAPIRVINNWADGDQHYFSFTLTDTGRLVVNNTINSSVNGVACQATIKSGSTTVMGLTCEYSLGTNSTYLTDYNVLSGNSPDGGVIWPVTAGTYDIWMLRYDSNYDYPNWPAGSTYQVDISLLPPGPGTTYANAYDLGTQTRGYPLTYNGSMVPVETKQYFKFTTTSAGSRTITLTSLTTNYNLNVVDSYYSYVGQSNNTGTTSESVTSYLSGSSVYYLWVSTSDHVAGSYTLTIT